MAVPAAAVDHQELAAAASHGGAEKAPLPAFQVFWKPAHTDRLFQASPGEDCRWIPDPSRRNRWCTRTSRQNIRWSFLTNL